MIGIIIVSAILLGKGINHDIKITNKINNNLTCQLPTPCTDVNTTTLYDNINGACCNYNPIPHQT